MAPPPDSDNSLTDSPATPVVRQPIVDREKGLCAYDLRFNSDPDIISLEGDVQQTWAWMRHPQTQPIDLLALASGAMAFLQITPRLLLAGAYSTLPGEKIILEVIDIDQPTDELVAACTQARSAGFQIAFDVALMGSGSDALLKAADVLSFDFLTARRAQHQLAKKRFAGLNVALHAGKILTPGGFSEALDMGFDYFEGPFLFKPEITPGFRIPKAKANYLRFMTQINRREIDFDELEEIVKHDVSLSVNLMKLINSPACSTGQKVESIKQALVLLGERPLRQWATLTIVRRIALDQPSELMKTGVIRARFCELLSTHAGMAEQRFNLFLLGLVSVLDAILNCPLDDVLDYLPSLSLPVKEALLGAKTPFGNVYHLVRDYERSNGRRMAELTEALGLSGQQVTDCYWQSVRWADQC